jgi:hypothetical protein
LGAWVSGSCPSTVARCPGPLLRVDVHDYERQMGRSAHGVNRDRRDPQTMGRKRSRVSRSLELEERLTNGYARVHELERRALRLDQHCAALLSHGASTEQLQAAVGARRGLERELQTLRASLEDLRAANDGRQIDQRSDVM